jgi:phosphoribosylanthranilate isomerase
VFVKICGITSEEDALLAVAMDADAIGFIFAPSKRQVSVALAREVARRLPPEVLTVGVFRDELPDRVVEIVNLARLRGAQLHGHETPAQTKWIRQRVPFVIKAFSAGDPGIERFNAYGADAVLIDSDKPGSGQVFDWTLTEGAPAGRRVILSGGLTPANVATAVEVVRPWGVDVATGVEASDGKPGKKDARKVRAFIAAARAADPGPYHGRADVPYDWMEEL